MGDSQSRRDSSTEVEQETAILELSIPLRGRLYKGDAWAPSLHRTSDHDTRNL